MLSAYLIVFRESLEAILVITLLLAATRGIPGRTQWIGAGTFLGVCGAAVVAGAADYITSLFEGVGQEVLNGTVLFGAAALLGWHNLWMSRQGKALAQEARELAQSVRSGSKTLPMLGFLATLTVLREGSELTVFMYGISLESSESPLRIALGAALGAGSAALAGAIIYYSLLTFPLKKLFTIMSVLVLFLTAGLAAQAATQFAAAGLLPSLGERLWDTSSLLPETSPLGVVMGALLGYRASPSGIQLAFYFLTITVLGSIMVGRAFGFPLRGVKASPA